MKLQIYMFQKAGECMTVSKTPELLAHLSEDVTLSTQPPLHRIGNFF